MQWLVVCVLFLQISAHAGEITYFYDGDSGDYTESCLPKLADDCFRYVSDNLNCHLNQPNKACKKKDADDLCSAIKGGLDCARDIIDGDCDNGDGRERFDLWMKGLENVHNNLCSNNMQLIKVLINSSACWNSGQFIQCLEQEKEILHVVDFLKTEPDLNNCFRFAIILSSCSAQASPSISPCTSPQNAVRELLHSFFAAGICSTAKGSYISYCHLSILNIVVIYLAGRLISN